eukprot:GFUD01087582.1.p1 GENE.GFUD01087582.1~~GFUD01087582.1.p1  ORF type:complete len:370 (+),score=92.61 GFUD01087582.1:112-1221(+)
MLTTKPLSISMPTVPKPVHDDLYEKNVTAWMMTTQDKILSETERLCEMVLNSTQTALDWVSQYVDLDYMMWIKWLMSPIIITFVILPCIILLLIYVSSLILYIYKAHRKRLIRRLATYVEQGDFWLGGREIVATLWDAHAWLWHGYELWGLENLPTEGGFMLLYYHGAIPVDYYYMVARVLLLKETMIHSVVDKFLFKVPGMKIILEAFCCTPGTVDTCAEQLAEGKILGLAPGGVYEAQFGDNEYKILWRERLGFARAALKANVPILPVFTENVREAFRVFPFGNRFFYWLFEKTRLPLRPVFGGFPVKLRTHIGEPIYPEPGMTPEEMRDQCKESLERIIAQHQRIPGSIFRGIFDRLFNKPRSHSD